MRLRAPAPAGLAAGPPRRLRVTLRAALPAGILMLLLVALPPFASAPLRAQESAGVLAGRVHAAGGDSALAGALVQVDGTLLRTLTDAAGAYRLGGLPPGRYTVRVSVLGYAAQARGGVEVTAGATTRQDFALAREVVSLPGVVVTAARAEQAQAESPASVAVIPQSEIRRRNVVTLSDALPYAGGVTYQGGQLDIRGTAGLSGGVGSRVLLMLDGHPILTGDTGEPDFDALPVLGVERIEIVKGPYSALYGSNALGGVVNVITSPVPAQPRTVMRAYLGAYDLPSEYRFTHNPPLTRGLELEQSLRLGPLATRAFIGRTSDDGFTQNGQVARWLGRAELALPARNGGTAASLYAIWSQEDVGEFFGWRSAQQRFEVPADALGDWYRMAWVNVGATVNAVTRPTALLRIAPYLYFDAVQNHFHDNADYHRANRMGSSVQLSLLPGLGQQLTLGGEAARATVASNILGHPTVWDYALFAQDEVPLGGRLRASVGARLDDHRVDPGRTEAVLSPKLGLVYQVSPRVTLRLSASRAFRAPSPVEQFVSTVQYGIEVIPNPDLHSETVVAGELGATADLGRLWLDGAIFQSSYRELIQPAAAPGQFFVFQFRNVDRARVRGLDLESRLALVPDLLGLHLTYMYLDPRDLITGRALPYRSAHTATATLTLLQGLLAADVQFHSRVQQVLQYPLDRRGAAAIVGLRAAYPLRDFLLQLRVSNLLQAAYVNLQERFPGAPRSVLLTISHGL